MKKVIIPTLALLKRRLTRYFCLMLSILMLVVFPAFADPDLSDQENIKKGNNLASEGKHQEAFDLYFKDLSPTPKHKTWLEKYKKKYKVTIPSNKSRDEKNVSKKQELSSSGISPLNLAVATLEAKEGVTQKFADLISDALRTELYKTQVYEVMNREDMEKVLKEMSFKPSDDCAEAACVVEMGKALGVSKMVAGSVGKIGKRYVINAKLIDVKKFKSEVLFTEYWGTEKKPTKVLRLAARTLTGLVQASRTRPRVQRKEATKPSDEPTPEAIRIAVTALEAKEGVSKEFADLMTDILRTEMYKTGYFAVMNREDMDIIFKEVAFQQSGACLEETCVVEMGQALGVPKMVTGSVRKSGKSIIIHTKIINVATSESEILVTEYIPPGAAMNPQPIFENVARQLAGLRALNKQRKKVLMGIQFGPQMGIVTGPGYTYLTKEEGAARKTFSASGTAVYLLVEYRLWPVLGVIARGGGWFGREGEDGVKARGAQGTFGLRLFPFVRSSKLPYIGGGFLIGNQEVEDLLPPGSVISGTRSHFNEVKHPYVELGMHFAIGKDFEIPLAFLVEQSVGDDKGFPGAIMIRLMTGVNLSFG